MIVIGVILPISDTLFDGSQAQRLQNQSVYTEVVYPLSLYRSFLSLYYQRSHIGQQINHDLTIPLHHPKDRRPFLLQCATTTLAFEPASTAFAPLPLYHLRLAFRLPGQPPRPRPWGRGRIFTEDFAELDATEDL